MENKDCCEKCLISFDEGKTWKCNNPSCQCHSKAPENMFDHTTSIKPTITANTVEAPTDESWEKQISSELHEQLKDKLEPWAVDLKKVFEIVASLIQKIREEAYNDQPSATSIYNKGKSEAFSLVRRAIAQNRKVTEIDWKEELTTADLGYNAALDDLLSTLEGK